MTNPIDQARQAATTPSVEYEELPELKFEHEGTEVYGEVLRTQFGFKTKFNPDGDANLIDLREHQYGDVTVWLSNVQLKAGLVDGNNQIGRPVQPGDKVYIRFDNKQNLEGGKTVKNFSIHVQAGVPSGATAQAQPVAPQAVPQAQPPATASSVPQPAVVAPQPQVVAPQPDISTPVGPQGF